MLPARPLGAASPPPALETLQTSARAAIRHAAHTDYRNQWPSARTLYRQACACVPPCVPPALRSTPTDLCIMAQWLSGRGLCTRADRGLGAVPARPCMLLSHAQLRRVVWAHFGRQRLLLPVAEACWAESLQSPSLGSAPCGSRAWWSAFVLGRQGLHFWAQPGFAGCASARMRGGVRPMPRCPRWHAPCSASSFSPCLLHAPYCMRALFLAGGGWQVPAVARCNLGQWAGQLQMIQISRDLLLRHIP